MRLSGFLKDKLVFLLLQGLVVLFVAMMLSSLGVGSYAVGFVTTLYLLVCAISLGAEYLKKRSYYKELLARLKGLDQKYLLTEMLEPPTFSEAEILCDVLLQVNKSMNDRVSEHRRASEDYREYIETWVHEIKTPIASAHLILDNNPGPMARQLEEELRRVEGYVEQALYYTRSNSVEKDYLIKPVNLQSLVSAAVRRSARPLIESHMRPCLHDLDVTVYTDEKWLLFILGQLLGNAIKYRLPRAAAQNEPGEEAQPEGRITVYAESGSSQITLTIADDGIGIPAQDLNRVFDKGFTGSNGRRYSKSTGMGLYLCKKLCTRLGLGIRVESDGKTGTTVRLTFPKSKMFLLEENASH